MERLRYVDELFRRKDTLVQSPKVVDAFEFTQQDLLEARERHAQGLKPLTQRFFNKGIYAHPFGK